MAAQEESPTKQKALAPAYSPVGIPKSIAPARQAYYQRCINGIFEATRIEDAVAMRNGLNPSWPQADFQE